MINMFNTYISPSAHQYISEVLKSQFLSEGDVVKEFEHKLETDLGLNHCLTLNSGTSALHLALDLAGVNPGDEVILPAQTFVASGLVILQRKAIPVFADIYPKDGTISVPSIREKISQRTKAIMPVHWGGYPSDLEGIRTIADEHHLSVIEDAAHALGAIYHNKKIGTVSDYTCFSFQSIKHLTTGDGGALCCKSEKKSKEAQNKRWFGIDRENSHLTELGERAYDIPETGYKYHMNNLTAALGIANLGGYRSRLERRIEIANFYRMQLNSVDGIKLFEYEANRQSAYWLFGMHVEQRIEFIRALKSAGIAASVVHQRIDRNSVFGGLTKGLAGQEEFDKTQIHIPIHDGISLEDAKYITDIIKKGW